MVFCQFHLFSMDYIINTSPDIILVIYGLN